MGIRTCDDGEGVAFLYESTGMRPLGLAAFRSGEDADSYCEYVSRNGGFGNCSLDRMEELRDEWEALPQCLVCDARVVAPHEDVADECVGCCELDEDSECDSLSGQIQIAARRHKLGAVALTGLARAVTGRADLGVQSDLRKLSAEELRAVIRRMRDWVAA